MEWYELKISEATGAESTTAIGSLSALIHTCIGPNYICCALVIIIIWLDLLFDPAEGGSNVRNILPDPTIQYFS
jgi:hypothetical protein